MKKVFTIAFAAMLACSFAFIGCGQSGDTTGKKNTPSAVVEKALKDLKNQDFKAALMHNEGLEDATDEEIEASAELTKALYDANGGVKDYEILGENISEDGQAATVDIKVTFGNGEVDEETQEMVLTENGWKMKM